MIVFDWDWIYGAGIGVLIADAATCEEEEIEWGVAIMFGIVMITFEKPKNVQAKEKPAFRKEAGFFVIS